MDDVTADPNRPVANLNRAAWEALNRAAFALALEAEEAAKTSRDFGRGMSHAARLVAAMRDALADPAPEVEGQMSLFDPDGMGGWTY